MLIKQITLKNFRQYKDKQTIEFSCDKEKNVTVLLGVNTSGKTTLIQAFNWCLYGDTSFKSRELINTETFQNMSPLSQNIVSVEIVLCHENTDYIIKRSQIVSKNENNSAICAKPILEIEYKEENGEMEQISEKEVQNTIEKILPEALSSYFFFDGEHISEINNRGNVASAVRGLMGLDTISEAVKHLNPNRSNSVIGKLKKELDVAQDSKGNDLKRRLDQAQEELLTLEERLQNTRDEINYLENRQEDLNNKILANSETKSRQEEKQQIEKDIRYLENNQKATEQTIIKSFTRGAFKFFALPLYDKVLEVINNATQDGEGIPKMHSDSIDFILKRGRCICGADLTMNQGAVNNIKHEQSLLPPQHIGTTIREFKKDCNRFSNEVSEYYETIKNNYVQIRENANTLDEKRDRYDKLSQLLQGNIDVGKFERDLVDNNARLRNKRNLEFQLASQIGAVKNTISSIESSLDSLVVATEKNQRVAKYIAYAQNIFEWFNSSYDKAEKEVKENLFESINKLFIKMYHGKRVVEIDDNYKITLKVDTGNGVFINDTSPGLDTVKNFAFIAGIVDLARKKVNGNLGEEDEIGISSEPYPIVMDAPFSNTDEIHIENISKALPEVAEQVILIVMNKDWEYAKHTMIDRVAEVYQIEKQSEIKSSIVPTEKGGII